MICEIPKSVYFIKAMQILRGFVICTPCYF